jgi:hypothetical protein
LRLAILISLFQADLKSVVAHFFVLHGFIKNIPFYVCALSTVNRSGFLRKESDLVLEALPKTLSFLELLRCNALWRRTLVFGLRVAWREEEEEEVEVRGRR